MKETHEEFHVKPAVDANEGLQKETQTNKTRLEVEFGFNLDVGSKEERLSFQNDFFKTNDAHRPLA